MATIKPLSETVLSAVRSGFIISSLATVVEELIYNSLDAGARKVYFLPPYRLLLTIVSHDL